MIWITFCIAWVAVIGWIVWGMFLEMEDYESNREDK
jgi:hypothetical protein